MTSDHRSNRAPAWRVRPLLALLLATWMPSCMTWSNARPPSPQHFAARRQVKVWAGTRSWRLHEVRLTADSLTGTDFMDPIGCDSCRIALSLAEVDSVKTGRSETASIAIIMVPLGLFLVLAAAWAASYPSS